MPNALECGFIEDTEALVQNEHSKTVQHNIKQEDLVHGYEYIIRPSCSSVGKQIKQEFYPVLGTLTLDTVEKKKTFPEKLETGGHTKYSALVCQPQNILMKVSPVVSPVLSVHSPVMSPVVSPTQTPELSPVPCVHSPVMSPVVSPTQTPELSLKPSVQNPFTLQFQHKIHILF